MENTLNWEALTIGGFRALSLAEPAEAAACWIQAVALLPAGIASDPRHAAAYSNAGVGHLMLGERDAAEACFQLSLECWALLTRRLPDLDVPLVATSSSFHFRLASGNVASFTDARRMRYARIAEAGVEISRYNAMFAHPTSSCRVAIEAAKERLSALLADILGRRAPEILMLGPMHETELAACYAEKLSNLEARRPSASATLSEDCDRLETACALLALFSPAIDSTRDSALSAEPSRQTEP